MGRSLMPLSLSRNHLLIKSLFSKRTFHSSNVLATSRSFNEREREKEKGILKVKVKESFLVQRYCSESDALYFSLLSTENWAPLREIRLPFFNRWRFISGSCGGILHLYDHLRNDLLWKPSTNEFKQLSPSKVPPVHPEYPRPHEPYGFVFDSQSQDYKVVKFSCDSQSQSRIELYSLKNDSWKEILEVGEEWDHDYTSMAYVNGRCYWYSRLTEFQLRKKIISFDFTSEKISHVILPPKLTFFEPLGKNDSFSEMYDLKLVEFDGQLGIIIYPVTNIIYPTRVVEIWVLQNGDDGSCNTSWTKEFEICVVDHVNAVHLSSDGRFLFLEGIDGELMVYDLLFGKLKKLGMHEKFVNVIPYVPTTTTPTPTPGLFDNM